MGLFFSLEGKEDVLGVDDVPNIVHRDECFLSSIDLTAPICTGSPATTYLNKDLYMTEDGTMQDIHPYAFSAKV